MNNVFCHIAGLTDETKIRLTNFLNKYDWKIINLDNVTKEIITHDTLNSLYNDFKQLKKNNDKEYKEIEKKMNKYWKSKFIDIVNLQCTRNPINILIGSSNHFKNIRQYVNINTKLKFFIEVNNNENAKNIIKKNLDNFKDNIINSTFPLQYLDTKYLVKKRLTLQQSYEKRGYSYKSIKNIINTISTNVKFQKEFDKINKLYIASNKLYEKNIDFNIDNTAYIIPWLAIILNKKFNNIKTYYNNKGDGYIEELEKDSFFQLDVDFNLYEVSKNFFYYYGNNRGLRLVTTTKIPIIQKYKINNILEYLDSNRIKLISYESKKYSDNADSE
jgi:hypothetical protein